MDFRMFKFIRGGVWQKIEPELSRQSCKIPCQTSAQFDFILHISRQGLKTPIETYGPLRLTVLFSASLVVSGRGFSRPGTILGRVSPSRGSAGRFISPQVRHSHSQGLT